MSTADFLAREVLPPPRPLLPFYVACVVWLASCATGATILVHEPECYTRPSPPADPVPPSVPFVLPLHDIGCNSRWVSPAIFCGRHMRSQYDGCRWHCVSIDYGELERP